MNGMRWLVVLSFATCSCAYAQWPDDARIATTKLGPGLDKKSVVIVRRCSDLERISEFTFEYPHLRDKSAAARAVNRGIVGSFWIAKELADCPTRIRRHAAERHDSISYGCQISSRHGTLLSLECHRGYDNATTSGRSGGYIYFLNFDLTDGRQLEITDLIGTRTDFETKVRARFLEQYKDDIKDPSEEFLDELAGNLARSCGFTDDFIVCSTLIGTNAIYDVDFPIADFCRELPTTYFGDFCKR